MYNTTYIPSSLVIILPIIQKYMTILLIILLFIGIFANIIACIIFYEVQQRKNACSLFCAATSGVNIFILIQGLVGLTLGIVLIIDPENYNLIYCKTRLYIRHTLIMINRTCTIFSCASCFALSSKRVKLRLLIKRTYLSNRLIIFFCFFWFLFCSHVFFFTTLQNNHCIMIGNYTLIFSIYMFILAGTISPILMILFSLLTLWNLKRLRQCIGPINQNLHLHKRDFQLIKMLLTQIIVYLVTTGLYPISLLYTALTQYIHKSSERIVIENLITFQTNNFLFYLNNVAPFFTYYFTSKTFRGKVKILWLNWINHQVN
jgi:hypothetical protein